MHTYYYGMSSLKIVILLIIRSISEHRKVIMHIRQRGKGQQLP